MTTKEMLYNHLVTKKVFTQNIHPMVNRAVNCISGEVPERLKLSIAISELVTYTSHLRKNIILHDGTLVPCNAITFALSGSGTAKDSSMNMVRKSLKPGYLRIEEKRQEEARVLAEKRAVLDGKSKEEWLTYFEKPKALQAGLGTTEGLIKHFSDLETSSIGGGSINASEIGSELLSNKDMVDIIKTLAIAYDLGKIPSKIIKSTENQTSSVECLPISALFFGSEDAILQDNGIKAKFKTIFTTQLARRSLFSFTPETVPPPHFNTIPELSTYRKEERERTVTAQQLISGNMVQLLERTTQEPLDISDKAQELFDVYKEYNQLTALDMSPQYPINRLARRHKQWLALKLSGNYAILDNNTEITEKNYVQAVNTVEMFSDDLMNFEKELVKEPYEIFCEICRRKAEDGKYTIGLHTLRKLGYIPTSGNPKTKIEELVYLASSYDKEAIYTACDEGICYEEPIKTDISGISYLEVSGTKEQRATKCNDGFSFYETVFEDLSGLLGGDYAYSTFNFKDGKRGKDNIIGGTKCLVLDIDKSTITDAECHLMLEGINHHIARTSDDSNPFKFRVLIELDAIVDIPDIQWKYFLQEVSKELGLEIDLLPKSQIYFSYEDREVLSETEGSALKTRELITKSSVTAANKPKPIKLSNKQQQALLDDPLETFGFSFNAESGEGSRSLMRAAYYARDLGATHEYIKKLMLDINNYWSFPMEIDKMETTILNQISRWY